MKIVHVLWKASFGGAERFVHDLAIAQRGLGHDARIWVVSENGWFGESARIHGVPVQVFPMQKGYDLIWFLRITTLLKKERFDVIHMHTGSPLFDVWARLLNSSKYIRHFHGVLNPSSWFGCLFDRFCNKFIEPSMHSNIFNSDDTLRRVRGERMLSIHNAFIIHCGIRMGDYKRTIEARASFRAELGVSDGAFVVGSVGRLCPQKGFEDFVRVAKAVKEHAADCCFVLVGDGDSRKILELLVEEQQVASFFKFMGSRNDVPELLSGFDCFVLPSRWEPFGIVCLEALAAGCPVVAYDIDGVREAAGVFGKYAEEGNAQQLANKVLEVINESNKNAERVAQLEAHLQKYDIKNIAERLIELYCEEL